MHPNDPIGFLTKNCAGVRNLGMQVKTFSTNMLLVRQSPRQNEWIPAFQCFSIQSWWAFNVMVTLNDEHQLTSIIPVSDFPKPTSATSCDAIAEGTQPPWLNLSSNACRGSCWRPKMKSGDPVMILRSKY